MQLVSKYPKEVCDLITDKKIASIDIGLKRIGTAICLDGSTAIPQSPILRKNRNQAARDVSDFLKEWEIDLLVIGLPKDGKSAEEMQKRIYHFAGLLEFGGEIIYIDEFNSSIEAAERMKGITRQKKDGRLDSIAAQLILERFLFKAVLSNQ